MPPELLADHMDPDWRWSPDVRLLGNPDAVVTDEEQSTTVEDILRGIGSDDEHEGGWHP